MAVLMREAIGGSLRRARTEGRRTLREVSRRARVSLGYLSEVERGRKEAPPVLREMLKPNSSFRVRRRKRARNDESVDLRFIVRLRCKKRIAQ